MNAWTWCAAILAACAVTVLRPAPRRLEVLRAPSLHRQRITTLIDGVAARVRRRLRPIDSRQLAIRVAEGWSAQLAAGRPTGAALSHALREASPHLARDARAVALGEDPERVFAVWAARRDGGGFAALLACWRVSTDVGGALADTVRRTANSLRAERAVHDEITAQLAAPRATARMVALLPLIGPVLGVVVGADSLGVLLTTPIGRGLLVGGLAFDAVGLWWVARLVRAAREVT